MNQAISRKSFTNRAKSWICPKLLSIALLIIVGACGGIPVEPVHNYHDDDEPTQSAPATTPSGPTKAPMTPTPLPKSPVS